MEVDIIGALGRYWGEAELRSLTAALQIEGEPVLEPGDPTCFLQNSALGVELTFRAAEALEVALRDYPPDALVLHNIRLYGPGSSTHAPFTGALPFGIRLGDSRQTLLEKLGPPDSEVADLGSLRWDTPVVVTRKRGFEESVV
jgi:hypothetical protein